MTELLHQLPPDLRAALERELGKVSRLETENKLLRAKVRLLLIKKYGAKSEQLSDAQFELLEIEPGVLSAEIDGEVERALEEKQEAAKPRRPHPGRTALPAHLPRVEQVIACTTEQCLCAQCGMEKKIIGYDISEELDVKPAEYFVQVIKREKRACRQCEEMGVSTAAAPELRIIEKGKASNRVIVDVLINKYANHLPLYRQSAILLREAGFELSRATLCGWVMQSGTWLEAVTRAMREDLFAGSYIQADETTVGVQSERTQGRNHQGYIWEYSRPGGPVIFDFRMGRGRDGPKQFLGSFNGVLQSDGYAAYDCIGGEGLVHAGCMAHARRGFTDALKTAPKDLGALAIVAQIAQLYAVEKEAREAGISHADRKSLRQLKSRPVLEALKKKIEAVGKDALPQSAVGKACTYALNQWPRLEVFIEKGEVEIDNNWCENAIRPVALGRKNWLHIGSEEAGPRIAAISSIIETCRRLGVNVRDYLLEVLPKIPSWPANRVAELTPSAWAAARAAR